MNSQTPVKWSTPGERHIRNAYAAAAILAIAAIPTAVLFGYFGYVNNQWQLWGIAGVLLVSLIINAILIPSIRRGRSNLVMAVLILNFIITVLATTLLVQGLGLIVAVAAILVIIAISGLTMPPRYALVGVIVAITAGFGLFLLDISYPGNRLAVSQIELYSPYIAGFMGLGFIVLGVREFKRFSLQVKIALGILVTGAITVSVLVFFGLSRSSLITNDLLSQYKSSNIESIKQQTLKSAENTAEQTNKLFSVFVNDIDIMSNYRADLETKKGTLGLGTYWDSNTRLAQFTGGQYGNSASDPASVFIPSTINVNEALFADLNTTAHFDFHAVNYLKSHPEVTAIQYVSKSGYTTQYPNINLVTKVPANFDPRTQPFYTISDPSNNPARKPVWVGVHQGSSGQGLIVTLSTPVYSNNSFLGVIGVDIQLQRLLSRISNAKIGKTGYAFLVDKDGIILAMPQLGYTFLGLETEGIPANESPKQSIIGKGSPEFQSAMEEMMRGRSRLEVLQLNNENIYFAFTPLLTPNYRLGFIVPENEFTDELTAYENNLENQIQYTLQQIIIILISLFIGAFIISLIIGQVITRPLLRLTKTVETISEGDLAVRTIINTEDETGTLSKAFNTMAERLSENLTNLEERISERTRELENANERIVRRANQFEAISNVAHTIRSTQTLESLLPLITLSIAEQFDFYHIGIFLVDMHKEDAILVAANSEGGKKMLERNHRLPVGGTSIVGYVTQSGKPRVALNVGLDSVHFNNPDLPDTRSEIALPLRIGAEIFGALDVQSEQTDAFTQEDIDILSTLADQVSVAIQNARSYQQTRDALAQAEASSIQQSEQQWKQFLTRQEVKGFSFDGVDTTQITDHGKQHKHSLAIPLTLRGAKIGSIKLSASDPDRTWTDDEIAMVQAAAERTSLALESARLLQEAQKRAAKERVIGEISAKIGSSSNLESVLRTAIQELGNTLPGTDIAIQFKKNQETE